MKIKVTRKSAVQLTVCVGAGCAAGFLNGFLGAGGGIILMYVFRFLNKDKNERSARDNFASVVAAIMPLSIVSAISYSCRGTVDPALIGIYIIPAAIGGIFGAIITDKINTTLLKTIFALIIIIAGVNMLL